MNNQLLEKISHLRNLVETHKPTGKLAQDLQITSDSFAFFASQNNFHRAEKEIDFATKLIDSELESA